MAQLSRFAAAADALESVHGSSDTVWDVIEGDDIEFSPGGSGDPGLGRVDASVSVLANDLAIHPLRKRVRPGGEIRFCITSRVRQEPDSCAAESFKGVARVVRAQVELVFGGLARTLDYSVALAACGKAPGDGVDLIASIPEDAEGSEVVLRRVIMAGCGVALGEASMRVIVGFNHEPASEGRVYAAAQAGDIPALMQALDDSCSTEEANEVGAVNTDCAADFRFCVRLMRCCDFAGACCVTNGYEHLAGAHRDPITSREVCMMMMILGVTGGRMF
jgi:hypothetical protein